MKKNKKISRKYNYAATSDPNITLTKEECTSLVKAEKSAVALYKKLEEIENIIKLIKETKNRKEKIENLNKIIKIFSKITKNIKEINKILSSKTLQDKIIKNSTYEDALNIILKTTSEKSPLSKNKKTIFENIKNYENNLDKISKNPFSTINKDLVSFENYFNLLFHGKHGPKPDYKTIKFGFDDISDFIVNINLHYKSECEKLPIYK